MQARMICDGDSIAFDGMTWPNPCSDRLGDIEWQLRYYSPYQLTKEEKLLVASVISAYRGMVMDKTQKARNRDCQKMREVITET